MPGMSRVPFDGHNLLTHWEFSPFALLVLVTVITVGLWYLRAQWAVGLKGRRWSRRRTVSFLAGLVVIDLALQSPVAAFTMSYFQAHVVQHLLLMVIAPPLLAMGAPMTLALQTSSRQTKVRLLKILNSRPFQVLTHPVPVWFLYYFSMFAFFLTFALNFAMLHMWVMDVINVGFLFASTLFWWPDTGGVVPRPRADEQCPTRRFDVLTGQHSLGRRNPVDRCRAVHGHRYHPGVHPVGPTGGAQGSPIRRAARRGDGRLTSVARRRRGRGGCGTAGSVDQLPLPLTSTGASSHEHVSVVGRSPVVLCYYSW